MIIYTYMSLKEEYEKYIYTLNVAFIKLIINQKMI